MHKYGRYFWNCQHCLDHNTAVAHILTLAAAELLVVLHGSTIKMLIKVELLLLVLCVQFR